MSKLKLKPKPKASSQVKVLEKFLLTYEKHCIESHSCASPSIKQGIKKCIVNEIFVTKFVLTNTENSSGNLHPVSLTPLLRTIRDERYQLGKELLIWGVQLSPQDIANLAILLELDGCTIYPFSKLEITHSLLDLWAMDRLGAALPYSNLSSLDLDYSKCGDSGVRRLIDGLEGNRKLLTLSLCYCGLGAESGSSLGTIITQTAICYLYLNGNNLQCPGAIELLRLIADHAESLGQEKKANTAAAYSTTDAAHQIQKANKVIHINSKVVELNANSKANGSSTLESSRKKKKRKGIKKTIKKPESGPWLVKLHLADNAIDRELNQGTMHILEFIQLLTCLIKNSEHLVEVDINGNAIGEQCAVKILEALKDRKKGDMPGFTIKVTPQISSVTFREIFRSCSKLTPTKKGRKRNPSD